MTIKSKILVPMTIISFIMALIVLISGIIVFNSYIDETMTEEVGTFSEQLEYQLDSLWDSATLSSAMVANDLDIRQALAANDRD
ncbi:MAG: hypothetical protein LBM93_03980, partial [Oscillospiraceae bacterium]|nr:hypothetical protein [Oscillospiraceae bacterium]